MTQPKGWKTETTKRIKCPFWKCMNTTISISCENPIKMGSRATSCRLFFAREREMITWVETKCTTFDYVSCPIAAALIKYYSGET